MRPRILLCIIAAAFLIGLPNTAKAIYFSGYIIFTVTGDPDDPATRNDVSSGWTYYRLRTAGLDPDRPIYFNEDDDLPMAFTWEHTDWDVSNAFLMETSGNSYYDYTGLLGDWVVQSGTWDDLFESDEAPYAFRLGGKGYGVGAGSCALFYYDHRGMHRGSGTWYTSETLPDYLADSPEPGTAALATLGLLVAAAVRRRGSRGSSIAPGGLEP